MKTESFAGAVRTFGRLLIVAAVVRSVTLARLICIANVAHDDYYQSADVIAETVQSSAVLDSARYFSKIMGEIVRGRLMERYYDQFDSVPTLVCIAIGIVLCCVARRMLCAAKDADAAATPSTPSNADKWDIKGPLCPEVNSGSRSKSGV